MGTTAAGPVNMLLLYYNNSCSLRRRGIHDFWKIDACQVVTELVSLSHATSLYQPSAVTIDIVPARRQSPLCRPASWVDQTQVSVWLTKCKFRYGWPNASFSMVDQMQVSAWLTKRKFRDGWPNASFRWPISWHPCRRYKADFFTATAHITWLPGFNHRVESIKNWAFFY